MAKNISNNGKTLKETLSLLDEDVWSSARTIFFVNYNDKGIIELGNIFENYRDYFETKLIETEVDEKFYYSPTYFSEFFYGTPDLDFLVLYFANIKSLFEFNKPVIKVLPQDSLVELNKIMIKESESVSSSFKNPEQYIEEDEVDKDSKIYQ